MPTQTRPPLLSLVEMLPGRRAAFGEHFDLDFATSAIGCPNPGRYRAVVTGAGRGLSGAEIAALPALEAVISFGAGTDRLDFAAARARGLRIANCPGINGAVVADHAMALLLGAARGIVAGDQAVRRGGWATSRPMRQQAAGKRLGLLGLGIIGRQIAQRAAGFDMTVAYCTRTPRDDVPWQHVPDLTALAAQSDFLVVACPGGAATYHLVNAAVLAALGPKGFLVNIGRGTVVDSPALAAALTDGTIAGAAVDVVEGEPEVPQALLDAPNLIITPHMAGRSAEAFDAATGVVRDNLLAFFAGKPMLTPVEY